MSVYSGTPGYICWEEEEEVGEAIYMGICLYICYGEGGGNSWRGRRYWRREEDGGEHIAGHIGVLLLLIYHSIAYFTREEANRRSTLACLPLPLPGYDGRRRCSSRCI